MIILYDDITVLSFSVITITSITTVSGQQVLITVIQGMKSYYLTPHINQIMSQ